MHWLVSHDFCLQAVFFLVKEGLHMQIFQTYCYNSCKDVLCRVNVKKNNNKESGCIQAVHSLSNGYYHSLLLLCVFVEPLRPLDSCKFSI